MVLKKVQKSILVEDIQITIEVHKWLLVQQNF